MEQTSASSSGAGFARGGRDWQSASFLMATFFLIAPIAFLLVLAGRGRRTPEEDYARAVREAMQPTSSGISHSLVSVSLDQPVKVVTWTRQKSISDYQGKTAPAYKDTWVTVSPYLKTFCQDYVKSHGADPKQLSLRLEQRLGLPPGSNYDTFVELTVDPKDISNFFRPCSASSPSTSDCQPALPLKPEELQADLRATDSKKKQEMGSRHWFLNAYYNSFASTKQYPWTSLGYTFDWAPSEAGDHLVRFGESEFVIPAGAAIKFNAATDTVSYCTSQ
jgi:hypothetical protein